MKESTRNALCLGALAGIVVLGGALRFAKLDASLWLDEILTYQRARCTLGYCVMNLTTPLHEMVTHFTVKLGHYEVFVRLPNVVAGLFTIALMYFAAKPLYGRMAGLIAALLMAVSAYHVHHSQYARYYAFMMLAGVLWVWLIDRCVTRGGVVNWTGFAAACFFGLLVHQFSVPFLAAMGLGAAVWVVFTKSLQGARPKLAKLTLLALCAVIGSTGYLGILVAQGKTPLQKLVAEKPSDGVGREPAPNPIEAETPSQLTPKDYLQYWSEMFTFQQEGWKTKYLLLALGLCGFVAVLRRRPSFAIVAFSTCCLLPLPLFLLRVSHQYGNRYFSMLVPIGYLLIAVGIVSVARLVSSRLPRRRTVGNLLTIPLLALLAPGTVDALEHYYQWQPAWNWKEATRYITRTLTPNDILYFIDPGHTQFNMTMTGFYFESFLKNYEKYLFSVREYLADLDEAGLRRLTAEYPASTLWFCAETGREYHAGQVLDRVCKNRRTFSGVTLWCLGEPTENMIANGDLEDPAVTPEGRPEFVQVVEGPEAFAGKRCVRLRVPETDTQHVQFRVNTPGHTVRCIERNPGFEAWNENHPAGWNVPGPSAPFVQRSADAYAGQAALAMLESPDQVAVGQSFDEGYASGSVIEASAQGKAASPNQLVLVLDYACVEGQKHVEARHPGGGVWAPMTLHEELPRNVVPGSIALRILRNPGQPGTVVVDDVKASLFGVRESLDPTKTYTLSMMMRYEGIRSRFEAANSWSGASVMISYARPEGGSETRHLKRFFGDSPWRANVFQLKPGRDLPLNASWLMVTVIIYGHGTIWLDNLQLEAKDHPTPFVNGVRLPHDEFLAQGLPVDGS